jgi:threonine/homoserine/homoserine lactone efflux protein
MPPIENMIAVLLAGFLLSATPGPSMLYVLSRSVGQSRMAGLASVLGLALGGIILAVATAMGLAQVFEAVPQIVVVLRFAGSVYLAWLGISMIWTARAEARARLEVGEVKQHPVGTIIWQGVVVELLNPKTVLFFALFLPPFVDASRGGDVQTQLLALGILVPLTAVPSDLLIAFMGGTMAQSINRSQKFRERLSWVGGMILIAIAVNLHLGLI